MAAVNNNSDGVEATASEDAPTIILGVVHISKESLEADLRSRILMTYRTEFPKIGAFFPLFQNVTVLF